MTIMTKKTFPSLHDLAKLHSEKTQSHYGGALPKTLKEHAYLAGALAKLIRVMEADATVLKVADDAMDVVKYMELFWASFAKRHGARINPKDITRVELFR